MRADVAAIKLLQAQDDFIFAPEKFTAFIGGLGSGKTIGGGIKALQKLLKSGQPGMVVAPTFPMLRDSTLQTVYDLLEAQGVRYKFNEAKNKLAINGTYALFRSAEKPDRLRGPNLNWVWLDEAALMRFKVWQVCLGRIRIGQNPQMWATTTPNGFNWLYDVFAARVRPNYKFFRASTRDNPHLPEDYVADLIENYSDEFAAQEIDGNFVAAEGLVYKEFNAGTHVVEPFKIPDHWRRYRAIDYGFKNPFVCLWFAVDGDGRAFIYDEHYQSRELIEYHARKIKERQGVFGWTVADTGAQENAEMQSRGIYTTNAIKHVRSGIQKVKARLSVQADGRPRLFVFSGCVHTIKEFGSYHWPPETQGKNEHEEPVKEHDHAMDTIRYFSEKIDGPQIEPLKNTVTKSKPVSAGYRERRF
jgi:PBSX family phage terminase large subunit